MDQNTSSRAGKLVRAAIFLALAIGLFAVVAAWDYVGLRLWGKN